MDNSQTIDCLEFCFGYGGNHLGLKRVIPNLRCIAASEIEAYACANLVAKMEAGLLDPFPIWTDVKTFPSQDFSGLVDIFIASYPCTPFSSAGKRGGADDPRHLWPFVRRSIEIIRPRLVLLENVEGHVSLGLREVLTELALLGYRVENSRGEPTWGIFSAAEIGAPHNRKRVFILAELDNSDNRHLESKIQIRPRWNATSNAGELAITNSSGRVHGESQIITTETRIDAQCNTSSSGELADTQGGRGGAIHTGRRGQGQRTGEFDGAGKKSADDKGERFREVGSKQSGRLGKPSPDIGSPSGEHGVDLVNPTSKGNATGKRNTGKRRQTSRPDSRRDGVGQADAISTGHQGCELSGAHEESQTAPESASERRGSFYWPGFVSRPGEAQHEWEPRRVASFERGLGGSVNGRAANVDRLRLLGNGVYPATAALAFATLYARLTK